MTLANPVGLAAGYDKNAVALAPLSARASAFSRSAPPPRARRRATPGPRLWRLTEDRAAINRFGFNNEGMEAILPRLAARPRTLPVGLNLGANKDSADRAADFARVLAFCGPHVDFATVNVSSPNTEKLRDLQGRAALSALLAGVMEARAALARPIPVFLKIAPDLTDDELAEIVEVALAAGLAGIVATNTTLSREGLRSAARGQAGGLSGAPLFERSTRVLAKLSKLTRRPPAADRRGRHRLAPKQAYAKIRAGRFGGAALHRDGLRGHLAARPHRTRPRRTAGARRVRHCRRRRGHRPQRLALTRTAKNKITFHSSVHKYPTGVRGCETPAATPEPGATPPGAMPSRSAGTPWPGSAATSGRTRPSPATAPPCRQA